MYVVALAGLAGRSLDAVLAPLAQDLGTTAYELRLAVNAGLPAILLVTVDEARARAALEAIRRRGFPAILLDRQTLVPSARMTELRDFELRPDGIVPSAGSTEKLAYADLRVLVRATHRSVTESVEEVKGRKFDAARAVATGGLIVSKKTTREVTSRTEERQQVLYLFRSGGPPWILRERNARYQSLGPDLRPTSLENFATVIRRLRASAPRAAFDERLATPRSVRGVADGPDATDLLARLVAEAEAEAEFPGS